MSVAFSFNAPAERLSLNQRMHWANRARIAREWRWIAEVCARNHAIVHKLPIPFGRSLVTVTFCVGQHRRRDADNAVATTKHIQDGLVDAKWFTDDTADRVLTTAEFVVDPEHAGRVIVTVEPLGAS